MFAIPFVVIAAATQTPVAPEPLVGHQIIDQPFRAQASSTAGITELHAVRDWHAALRGVDSLLVNDFFLDDTTSVILELERRTVIDPGADLRLGHAERADRPDLVMLGGAVAGDPASFAYLAFSDTMTMGFVQTEGEQYVISSGPHGHDLPTVVYNLGDISSDTISLRDIACRVLDVPGENARALSASTERSATTARRGVVPCRVADVAIDTDTEFRTALFAGDATAAADYATMLVGAVSEVYERDLNVKLNITFLRIWDTPDPWGDTDIDGDGEYNTIDQLLEFRSYWLNNETEVDRDLAHHLSGRNLGGGVAWGGVVCNPDFGFAHSANLNGFFPYPLQNQSTQNWDFMVTAHEWGHNFGAPHTHEQAPLANVDNCGNGDCSGAPGTIMSYCHLCGNGTGDVNLNFAPQNINSYMLPHLEFEACDLTGDPLCADAACAADTNNDGVVSPADFNAWILAFNSAAPECDQNGDGLCTPADFNAWILNYNAGC